MISKRLGRWIAVIGIMTTTTMGYAAVKIGGKTAADVFTDPQTLALVNAACAGDLAKINALVKQGANVNATGYRDTSALVWAMFCKNYVGIEELLKLGANPNYKMEGDISAMYASAGSNDPHFLPMMLAHGGDPNIRAGYRTALMVAIQQDQAKNVQLLLDHGADVNEHDEGGNSAATMAVARGNFEVIKALLKRGYNYDLRRVAIGVDRTSAANQHEETEKQQVLEMLKVRGVKFPLPAFRPTRFPPPPELKPSDVND